MVGPAGAEGENFCTDCPAADNVGGCVADNKHFRPGEFLAEQHFAAGECDFGQFISVFVIITEGADSKRMPEIEVAQFDFGAEPDIAGQKSYNGPWGEHREIVEKLLNASANSTCGVTEVLVQQEHVTSEKALDVHWRGLNAVRGEELTHERCVSSAGKTHVRGAIADAELEFACAIERANTRAAGADQGAIDVEQYQSDHASQATGWCGLGQVRLPGLLRVPANPATSPGTFGCGCAALRI